MTWEGALRLCCLDVNSGSFHFGQYGFMKQAGALESVWRAHLGVLEFILLSPVTLEIVLPSCRLLSFHLSFSKSGRTGFFYLPKAQ